MYRTTGSIRILRKSITIEQSAYKHGTGEIHLIGHEDVLQQEFRCDTYENLVWRDVPIMFVSTEKEPKWKIE